MRGVQTVTIKNETGSAGLCRAGASPAAENFRTLNQFGKLQKLSPLAGIDIDTGIENESVLKKNGTGNETAISDKQSSAVASQANKKKFEWNLSGTMSIKKWFFVACLLGVLPGCANVKPYEREILSNPIMQLSTSSMSDIYEQHMHRALSQGLVGMPAAGGGCGCEQ